MKTAGIFEAKTHLSRILTEVENNEEYIIKKRGKKIAIIQPIEAITKKEYKNDANTILQAFKEIRDSQKPYGKSKTTVKEMVNDGRKY